MRRKDALNQAAYRTRLIRAAGVIALAGNLILTAVKIFLAHKSSSLAVLGDGIDSLTDVLIAAVTLVISGIISKPGDREHPWGHGRAETVATMVLAFIIFLAGSELCISAAKRIIARETITEVSAAAVWASVISICGKVLLTFSQYFLGKKAKSDLVLANAQNMRSDIVLSAAILTGISLARIFRRPVLDPVTAIIAGLWVIKNAVELFKDLNMELMDGNTDSSLYKKIFNAVKSVPGVENPHRARIRKLGASYDISLDIEVPPDMTVYDAHEKAEQVEEAIRKSILDVYDVMIHIEPENSSAHQRKEEFGLSPGNMEE
ncbi:MAG: cation transporter [Treponema sp.]|nr:cation transporter [Treponema sp.]